MRFGSDSNKMKASTPNGIWQSAGKDREDIGQGRESILKAISLPSLPNMVKSLPTWTWLYTRRFNAAPLILPLELIPLVWDSPTMRQKREKSGKKCLFIWLQVSCA